MHRVRLALPYLRAQGWDCTVLAIAPQFVEGAVLEPELAESFPSDVRVIQVKGVPYQWTRPWGIGSIWFRCGRSLQKRGDQLLSSENFDLVFISTSQFGAFQLGPRWLRRFAVPYVIDLQDPWVTDHYGKKRERPPGGRMKYAFAQFQARRKEPEVVTRAAGIICVSRHYPEQLRARYEQLPANRIKVLPFGASAIDLSIARASPPAKGLIDLSDGRYHHVFTGRCTAGMRPSLDILFLAFSRFLQHEPTKAKRHRFHFIGTNYTVSAKAEEMVIPAANHWGVSEFVQEHTHRVPYFEATYYTAKADSVLVLGSNDPTYNASKLEGSLMTNNPLLLIAHRDSPMTTKARELELDFTFAFTDATSLSDTADDLRTRWFQNGGFAQPRNQFANARILTAENMTRQLTECFADAINLER